MREGKGSVGIGKVFLFVTLFLFWLVLVPGISVQSVIAGILVSAAIVVFTSDLLFTVEEMPLYNLAKIPGFIVFIIRLIGEIFSSAFQVSKIVLSPSLPISPNFVKVPLKLKSDMGKAIYANAITLTPGTLTIDLVDDYCVIHALTTDAGEGLEGSMMEKYCMKLEG